MESAELNVSQGKGNESLCALTPVTSTLGAIWSIWQILKHLPLFVCLKDDLEVFVSSVFEEQNELSESSLPLERSSEYWSMSFCD